MEIIPLDPYVPAAPAVEPTPPPEESPPPSPPPEPPVESGNGENVDTYA